MSIIYVQQTVYMEFSYKNKKYEVILGSDVVRDGMFLEINEVTDPKHEKSIMEVFFNDEKRNFTFNAWEPIELPLEKIELFIKEARKALPPIRNVEKTSQKKGNGNK